MIGNIFVQSWLTDLSNLLFLFHKIKQWMWRMFLPNSFQKCRSSRSQMFFRSSRPEMFCKKAVLRDFPKFTRKHLCQSLFITKVAGQGRQLYLKRDPVSWCFLWVLWNLEEHLFSFLTEHLWWLPLVLQNRRSYKFPDIHQKISVLNSLFNTVRDLKVRNFNKKRDSSTSVFLWISQNF